ncbi:hypothetical protein [Azospirillum doebereinerae]
MLRTPPPLLRRLVDIACLGQKLGHILDIQGGMATALGKSVSLADA